MFIGNVGVKVTYKIPHKYAMGNWQWFEATFFAKTLLFLHRFRHILPKTQFLNLFHFTVLICMGIHN